MKDFKRKYPIHIMNTSNKCNDNGVKKTSKQIQEEIDAFVLRREAEERELIK